MCLLLWCLEILGPCVQLHSKWCHLSRAGQGCHGSSLCRSYFVPTAHPDLETHTTWRASSLHRLLNECQIEVPEILSTYVHCFCFFDHAETFQLFFFPYVLAFFLLLPKTFPLIIPSQKCSQVAINPGFLSNVFSSSIVSIVQCSWTKASLTKP